jgi:hypothetical protein
VEAARLLPVLLTSPENACIYLQLTVSLKCIYIFIKLNV